MLEKSVQDRLIHKGRDFMKGYRQDDEILKGFESDQNLKLPQPPLVKAPIKPESEWIRLSHNFDLLQIENNLQKVFRDRRSARIYTQEPMSQLELSFLLWATQGIKSIRGKSYATLRTVPCGGARHQYETYLLIRNVDGLAPGAYHYLPMEHALEFLHPVERMEETITDSVSGQNWAAKANVVFYWSLDAYRVEWRYGVFAHRTALIDLGHIGQNLYLAATGIGLGCCAIAAFQHEVCNRIFDLDGEGEFVVYTIPVGTIRDSDKLEEHAFYKFVEEDGL